MKNCEAVRSRRCHVNCTTECFKCGLMACKACTVKIPYLRYGRKRICLNCLDEMARFGDLDYLTLSTQ